MCRKDRTIEATDIETRITIAAKKVFGDQTDLPPAVDFKAVLQELVMLRPIHKSALVPKRERRKKGPEAITSTVKAEDVKVFFKFEY